MDSKEIARKRALEHYNVDDNAREHTFDSIAAIAAKMFAAPVALVGFVDNGRLSVKSIFGGSAEDVTRHAFLCTLTVQNDGPSVVADLQTDPRVDQKRFDFSSQAFRFYAGAPLITPGGHRIGVVCVFDRGPRHVYDNSEFASLSELARLTMDLLEAHRSSNAGAVRPEVANLATYPDMTTATLRARPTRSEVVDAFRSLPEVSQIPMWIYETAGGRFADVNKAAVSFYGWSKEQFSAMSMADLLVTDSSQASPSAGSSERHLRSDGSIVSVNNPSAPQEGFDHGLALRVIWDMTDLERTRDSLQESNERLQQMTDELAARTGDLVTAQEKAKLGSWRVSRDKREVYWSDEIYTLIGRSRAEYAPSVEHAFELIHPDDHHLFSDFNFKDLGLVRGRKLEARVIRADGGVRNVVFEYWAAEQSRAAGGVSGYIQDVSERKEAERALISTEKLAILGHLTGGVAHEFNNILTVIGLNLEEAVADLSPDDDMQAILVPALQASQRGGELTSQLLAYARQAPLNPHEVDLLSFITTARPLLQRSLSRCHQLVVELPDIPISVSVDPAQLHTAITNVLINARQSMPLGGTVRLVVKQIRLPDPEFEWPPDAPSQCVLISVTDQGCGIPSSMLPRMFEPFVTSKAAEGSSGLGLSMVDGFVRQSGGCVAVRSNEGCGTTICLLLPVKVAGSQAHAKSAPYSYRPRALLVDDQPSVLATVSRMFVQLGFEVCAVSDAKAAILQLDQGAEFDVLFSDIVLPGGMNGIDLSKIVRARLPATRVLLTSGFNEYLSGDEAVDPSEILMKPYKRQELLSRLSQLQHPAINAVTR